MGITQHHTNTNIMWALVAAVAATTLVAWKFNQRIRAHVAMRKALELQEAASRPLDSAAVGIVRVLEMPADASRPRAAKVVGTCVVRRPT